jgi:Tol biopolymer transport system component
LRIAFVRDLNIWMMRGGGRHQHHVTTSASWNIEPTFSPDGGTLAFASNRTGTWNIFELASRRPYGQARQISYASGSGAWAEYPVFAPDGSLYWIERAGGEEPSYTIMHAAADGSPGTAAAECFSCWRLDMAPNGHQLLWSISSSPNGVDCGQLARYDLLTTALTTIRDCVDGQGLTDAGFSPDGKRLVACWYDASGRWLVITDLAGRHRHRLPGTREAAGPAWQPIH